MNRSVFISYSSTDRAPAGRICDALEQAGYTCWIAPRDIEPGADYPSAILAGIQDAKLLVVVVSPAAVTSPHILTEIEHAFDRKKPILPFRLTPDPLPPNFDYFLATSQWLDAPDGCTPENLNRLKEAVAQELAGKAAPVDLVRSGKRVYWLAAVLLLVLASGLAFWRRPAARVVTTDAALPSSSAVIPDNHVAVPAPVTALRQKWVNPKDGLTYVRVPPGTLTMGCSSGDSQCRPDETPTHLVEIPSAFWIGETEVTNSAYHRVVPTSAVRPNEANLPVVRLSWLDAKAYCIAAGGRLPVEAEWEYAARAGTSGPFYGVPSKIAWYGTNSAGTLHQVAALQPNAYGLFDMLGNASEWVLDRYYNQYDVEAPAIGNVDQPLAPNAIALTRGGFWESDAAGIRVSRRVKMEKDDPAPMAGVRCVVEPK
jgi:formylglycine-generating enzyme required for sulfatase activity